MCGTRGSRTSSSRPLVRPLDGERLGGVVAGAGDAVVGVDEDHAGLAGARLGVVHLPVADEDDEVAGVHQPGGRAVDADDAGAARAGDDVGLQAGAVGDVDDRDLLALEQVGGVHEVLVDGDGADVVQVGLRHGGAVDLALEHGAEHQAPREDAVVEQAGACRPGRRRRAGRRPGRASNVPLSTRSK